MWGVHEGIDIRPELKSGLRALFSWHYDVKINVCKLYLKTPTWSSVPGMETEAVVESVTQVAEMLQSGMVPFTNAISKGKCLTSCDFREQGCSAPSPGC